MRPSWDIYGLMIAHTARIRSLDPRTHHGAYLTDINNNPISIGYNSPPARWPDELVPKDSPEKLKFFVHAEENALRNNKNGHTIYITGFPCLNCAKLICANGIKRVICTDFISNMNRNDENYLPTIRKMFEWSNIEFVIYSCEEYENELSRYYSQLMFSNKNCKI